MRLRNTRDRSSVNRCTQAGASDGDIDLRIKTKTAWDMKIQQNYEHR